MVAYHLFPDVRRYATVQPQAQPVAGHRIVFGLLIGAGEFHGCVAIMDATAAQIVQVFRFIRLDYGTLRDRIKSLYEIWKPQAIYTETGALAGANIEALQAWGLPIYPVDVTSKTKQRLLQDLALGLIDERLTLVPDEGLIAELSAYKFESHSGRESGVLPPEMTGDSVIATALAQYGSTRGGISIRFA